MTVTQTGRRVALVGLLAMVAALLPLTVANAQLTASDTQYIVADDGESGSIKHSRLTYTPLTDAGPDNPTTEVLIGTAAVFADNLAAGVLSGALDSGRPLFLNDSADGVSEEILSEIARVTTGTDAADVTVHILGGTAAQGEGVETALEDAGYAVNRFAGATRIETAIAINGATENTTVMVVRAFPAEGGDETQAFADSLTAAGVAASNDYDMVFTQTEVLTGSTADYLAGAGYESAIVVGGEAAISADVMSSVAEIIPDTTRVAGDTRFDTAIALNELRDGVGPFAILTDGQSAESWQDAFAAANWSGLANAPILLTNQGEIPEQTQTYLEENHESAFASHGEDNFAFCGWTVGADLCQEVADIFGGTTSEFDPPVEPGPPGNEDETTRPDLTMATLGELVLPSQATPTNPAGARIAFDFDEPIASTDFNFFEAYQANGTVHVPTAANLVSIDTDDNSIVNVIFDTVNSQAIFDSLTVAAADITAAVDFQGQDNTMGDFAIGMAVDSGVTAGVTAAPDVLTASGFRINAAGTHTAVDFTFDEVAYDTGVANNFGLVRTDGTMGPIVCAGPLGDLVTGSGTNVAGGNGTTTITVLCPNDTVNTALNAANFARGYVVQNGVSDSITDANSGGAAAGNGNPLETADISAAGFTTDPDLMSGSFNLDIMSGGNPWDAAVFTFDNPLAAVVDASVGAYLTDGSVQLGGQLGVPATQISGTQALVYFPNGALSNAVGIFADQNAVTDTGGLQNENDEEGVENPTIASQMPGFTVNPELTDVIVGLNNPPIGTPVNQAQFVFDEDVDDVNITVTDFSLFHADGTQLVGNTCATGTTEDTDNIVTCTAFDIAGNPATSAQIGDAVYGGVEFNAIGSEGAAGADSTTGGESVTAG